MCLIKLAKSLAKEHLLDHRYEHAKRVVELLCKYSKPTDNEIAAAYLHDILEDTYLRDEYVIEKVGENVYKLIKELTNPVEYYGPNKCFDHMKNASKEAKRIKLCDRIDNMIKRIKNKEEYIKKIPNYIDDSKNLLEILESSDKNLSIVYKNTLSSLQELI